jgi:hypothetical protein
MGDCEKDTQFASAEPASGLVVPFHLPPYIARLYAYPKIRLGRYIDFG